MVSSPADSHRRLIERAGDRGTLGRRIQPVAATCPQLPDDKEPTMTRILIVDDDELVASFLQKGFAAHGYTTSVVDDADEAVQQVEHDEFDLLILDIALPGREGLHALSRLRSSGNPIAVIVLTGRPDLRDAAACLDVGADDYVTKPFHFDELLARVRARMRPPSTPDRAVLDGAGVHLDVAACRAVVEDRTIDLTARELALLELLMRHPGQVFSPAEILDSVWKGWIEPGSNVINVYNNLRRKLCTDAIESLRGVGYRFRDD
jgi:DNA-binding response OmpR family regulator